MFHASAWFARLPPDERKALLTLLHDVRRGIRNNAEYAMSADNYEQFIYQLEHDHEDGKRVERREREAKRQKR